MTISHDLRYASGGPGPSFGLHSVFIFPPALVRIMDGYKVDTFFVLCASF